jgi:hypothetical protein
MKVAAFLALFFMAVLFASAMVPGTNAKMDPTWNDAPEIIVSMLLGDMSVLVLSPEQGRTEGKDGKAIRLGTPTQAKSELKSYLDGGSIFFGSPKDGTKWMNFGHRDYREMAFNGKTAKLNSFQQNGESWACVIDGILYQEVAGVATTVATTEFRTFKANDGKEHRAQMCKRPGQNETWCFAADGDKVYRQEPTGTIAQIGWLDWRVVVLPQGEKVLMLMTKGMSKNAGWTGRHEGKRYVGE